MEFFKSISLTIFKAAAVIAGAVFLPTGSSKITDFSMPICFNCSAAKKRWSELQITRGFPIFFNPFKRVNASWNRLFFPNKEINCFGCCCLDKGQIRVPKPPDKIIGIIVIKYFKN